MNNMFKGCSNLKYLDINNCDDITSSVSSMFDSVNNLEYINIYNVSSNGNLATAISTELNIIDNLFVCQKNRIITNPQDTYVCCNYNITISKCQLSNWIRLFFNQDTHYESGFINKFRYDIAFALSIMIRKYFDLTPKGKELLKLIEPELSKSKLRDVIDFEVDYVRKSYEKDVSELNEVIDEMSHSIASKDAAIADKDAAIADKDAVIADKDEEIRILKEKLAKNGIQ